MPYLSNLRNIRRAIFYSLRYMIPTGIVWLMVLILSKTIKKGKIIEEIKSPRFLALTSAIITLLISYSATVVRNDVGIIVSRATYVIVPIGGILLFLIIKKYFKLNLSAYLVIGFTFGIALILNNAGISSINSKFIYAYNINPEYEIISEELKEKYPRLGTGFIKKQYIDKFKYWSDRAYKLLEYDENLKFIGWGELGVYYTLDLTTVGQPSLYAAKDYKTHNEVIEAIKEQKPVVGMQLSTSVLNYYLYNWLLTTDEYVYDSEYEAFLPTELFHKIHGKDAIPTDKREIDLYATDVGRVPNSLGQSIKTLESIMNKKDVKYNIETNVNTNNNTCVHKIKLGENILGTEADFMYVEFDVSGEIYETGQSKIGKIFSKQNYNDGIYAITSWQEDEGSSILSILGKGKLLIPLGSNVNWLLNEHEEFKITIQNVDKQIDIKNIEFYKLQTSR